MAKGTPRAEILRYDTAISPALPSPPISETAGDASKMAAMNKAPPSPTESQSARAPRRPAAASSPAPCRRATRAVVP
ncbi:MAG TPA: hypothetical protein VFI90_16925 [Rubrobacter sp.]|nr:hypothetical protein [Rubrobacter sp.]